MSKLLRKRKFILLIGIVLCVLLLSVITLYHSSQTKFSLSSLNDNSIIDIRINGSEFKLEVALTAAKRATGLMNRDSMPKNQGMIFVFDEPRILSFYMKNTFIPLDIIFLDKDLKVINIHKNTKTNSETPLYSSLSKSQYVLELNGGISDSINLRQGDVIEITNVQ